MKILAFMIGWLIGPLALASEAQPSKPADQTYKYAVDGEDPSLRIGSQNPNSKARKPDYDLEKEITQFQVEYDADRLKDQLAEITDSEIRFIRIVTLLLKLKTLSTKFEAASSTNYIFITSTGEVSVPGLKAEDLVDPSERERFINEKKQNTNNIKCSADIAMTKIFLLGELRKIESAASAEKRNIYEDAYELVSK